MRKFRKWFLDSFLPSLAKDTVYQENKALKAEIGRLKAEITRLNTYIDGLEDGFRAQRRVVIHNEVKK